jgi:hypothetical protein
LREPIGGLIVKIAILCAAVLDLEALAVGMLQAHLMACDWIFVHGLADEIGCEAVGWKVAGRGCCGWRGCTYRCCNSGAIINNC